MKRVVLVWNLVFSLFAISVSCFAFAAIRPALATASSNSFKLPSQNPSSQSLNDVLPEGGVVVVAPQDEYSWRLWPGGKIERSTDNSRTWVQQKSGVTKDLTAGSAPSGKVCWVVGKAGTILLTSDGGKHWKALISPIKEDVAGVFAQDDKHASIWTASHSLSFDTNDAGATWTPNASK
jgi:photosystem II stability/assembly factor-like uncharacterized protein